MIVSTLSLSDVDDVIAIAVFMHGESALRGIAMDTDKLRQQLVQAISNPAMYLRSASDGVTVLGILWGGVSAPYWSRTLVAVDRAWFVRPEHRSLGVGKALLLDFESWAKKVGARWCMPGQTTGVAVDATRRLYEHLGYQTTGFNTLKELGDV